MAGHSSIAAFHGRVIIPRQTARWFTLGGKENDSAAYPIASHFRDGVTAACRLERQFSPRNLRGRADSQFRQRQRWDGRANQGIAKTGRRAARPGERTEN